jgi:2-polyprenyl-3-methyl-5-hydroxy-6-metoxy-1,4-benzoquinol methylase
MGNNDTLHAQAQREAHFFDNLYAEAGERFREKRYSIPEELVRQIVSPEPRPLIDREYASSLIGGLAGKKVLDYGAGDGWNTICLAKAKARVWAIDISEVGIDLTKRMAAANDVSDLVTAEVQDCYKTRFETDAFDVIYGGGIIHHLDISEAGKELSRILRPDGVAVFCEPIRESNITDYIKAVVLFITRRKPQDVTADEDVLTLEKIRLLRRWFKVVKYRQFIVFSSATALVRLRIVKRLLLWIDYLLIKWIPGFARLGRSVVIELREPIKADM